MTKKTDLRVVKTKKALSSAMLMLLRDMPFAKITVNEICARALVSRSAFYTHFLDKYDLAVYCLDDVSAQLFDMVQEQSVQAQLRSLIENIRQNSRLFENLLMADYDAELMEILRKGFLRKFYKQQGKSAKSSISRLLRKYRQLSAPPASPAPSCSGFAATCNIPWMKWRIVCGLCCPSE